MKAILMLINIITIPVWKGVKGVAFEKVKEIVVEQLGVEEDEVTLEASFIDIWELILWISLN
jgi:hypothetical protein